MNYLLEESEEPICEALQRLVEKDEIRHPFVLVTKVGRPDIFVQFATNRGVLYFDVPRLGIVLQPVVSIEAGAAYAVEKLAELGVQEGERVLVGEEEDQPRKKISLLKWLLA